MRKWQKAAIILGVVLIGIAVVIAAIYGNAKAEMKRAGEKAYSDLQAILGKYPTLDEPLNHTIVYYQDETMEYMLIKAGQRQITATRSEDGNTEYYYDGKNWQIDSEGVLVEKQSANDPVENILADRIGKLLKDQGVVYSYHYADALPLPMWVYPGEYYLRCDRPESPSNMETMVRGEEYVRWSMLDEEGTVFLFLYAWKAGPEDPKFPSTYLHGWGRIEDSIWNIFNA